jgi:sec-independent protein translocase protein TatA
MHETSQPGSGSLAADPLFADGSERRTLLAMGIGAPELLIVLLVVLVIFGGSQLPKLARGLGSAQREFKKGLDEGAHEDGTDSEKSKKPE